MSEQEKKVENQERKRQYNVVQLSGNLGKDPEVFTGKNMLVTTFPLPVENDDNEKAGWVKVVCFGDLAKEAGDNLKKGMYVQIKRGRLKVVSWEKDGKKGVNVEIIAYEINYNL